MISPNHDSHEIRASILDVCLQLGALDSSNPVADWMFSEPSSSGPQSNEEKRYGSRFHERISPSLQWEGMTPVLHVQERHNPLSVVRFKPTSKSKSKPNTDPHHPDSALNERTVRRETGFSSLRSFFRRISVQKPEYRYHDVDKDAYNDGGRVLTNSRSLLRSKHHSGAERLTVPSVHGDSSPMPRSPLWASSSYEPQPIATPAANVLNDDRYSSDSDSDDDWEEIEIRPQSFLYALQHENKLPPGRRLKKNPRKNSPEQYARADNILSGKPFSFAIPRPHTPKGRRSTLRPLAVYGTHHSDANAQSLSTSTPPSPVILVTPADTPPCTPLINAAFQSPREPQLVHRPSMGYHNQFFVRDPQPATQKFASSLPPSSPSSPLGLRHPTPPL